MDRYVEDITKSLTTNMVYEKHLYIQRNMEMKR